MLWCFLEVWKRNMINSLLYSFVLNYSRKLYCIFSKFSPPKSFFNDRPILPKCEIGTYPHMLLSTTAPPPPPPSPILKFFDCLLWNYSILFLELWLFTNNCDRTSTIFYIPTTNQCLIFFTNHTQILSFSRSTITEVNQK